MSQIQSDPSQTSPTPARPADDDEPLAHLHKMSTTAGLGSGEYVAVNGAAVFALLLGLASGLSLLAELLLILPLTCIIVSIIAWRQINQSNATQTGKGLVVVGLACALAFGGFVVAREATAGIRTREDRAALRRTIEEFGEKIKAGDIAGAHNMTSERFRQQVDLERFKTTMSYVRESDLYGRLQGTEWNELASFETDPATGQRYAVTKFRMRLDKTEAPIDIETTLRREGDEWIFESIPTFFPSSPPGR